MVSSSETYSFLASEDIALEARFERIATPDAPSVPSYPNVPYVPYVPAPSPTPKPTAVPAQPTPPAAISLDSSGEKGYISGYVTENGQRYFNPNGDLTRYEAATIVFNLVSDPGKTSFKGTASMTDLQAEQWYSQAVSYLVTKGVISGYPDGSFRGVNKITRAEFIALLSPFIKGDNTIYPFTDLSGHWASALIAKAFGAGIISGYPDSTFRPNQLITRAEAVIIANRILGYNKDKANITGTDFTDVKENDWFYKDVCIAANGLK
jgi:hypothetical protein